MVASATLLSPASEWAWVQLVRVSGAVLGRIQTALKAEGFPPLEWYDVLLELSREPDGRLRQNELGRRLLIARYNLSRLLDRLEREALVVREACADDARGAVVALTPKGCELRVHMWPVYAQAIQAHLGDRLSDGEAERLAALLSRLA